MIIGVPKEIKNNENRVGLIPSGVYALTKLNNTVLIEKNAGLNSGYSEELYIEAGATIIDSAKEVYKRSEMIIKVKEPQESEFELLQENQILFTYLHLAPDYKQAKALLDKKVSAIAYETVQKEDKSLPLLAPMSEIAGKMSVQIGATLLQKNNEGKGVLLGGVSGVLPAEVLIIGAGVVGTNAARVASGMGARVIVADVNLSALKKINDLFNGHVNTMISSELDLLNLMSKTDLLISSVLVPGSRAPKVISEEMVKKMQPGSVIVDVAIDQGGSVETIDRTTSHDNPYYIKHGVIHYSVANMPGAVSRSSTQALTAATISYIKDISTKGLIKAIKEDSSLKAGLNTYQGKLTYKAVSQSLNIEYTDIDTLI